jgi:mannitol/fructose-specific phosphotransferase system IIA component (Ntr-type)/RNase P subunit RPR2
MKKLILSDVIGPKTVHLLKARKKDACLKELLTALGKAHKVRNTAKILKEIQLREKESPTGFGRGIAIPHHRLDSFKGLSLMVGISRSGVDYGSPDGIPVRVVFLILAGKGKEREYLRLVAGLVNFVNRENLILHDLNFGSIQVFLDHLKSFDADKPVTEYSPHLTSFLRYEEILNEISTLSTTGKNPDEKAGRTTAGLVAELKKELEKTAAGMDRMMVERIQRLAEKYKGSISARIFNEACSYCFSQPSALELNAIRKGRLIYCLSCGKVLYFKE